MRVYGQTDEHKDTVLVIGTLKKLFAVEVTQITQPYKGICGIRA
jgi:hypothetical protein